MKKFLPLVFLSILLLVSSCSKDEDNFVDSSELIVNNQEFNLDENAPANTIVGLITATNILEGRDLMYNILTNDTPFVIHTNTGQFTVADGAIIDFETIQTYTFIVEVTNGISTKTAEIIVRINDLSESGISAEERARLVAYFKYLALREDEDTPSTNITKWLETMTVFMTGDFSANDSQIVTEFIQSINPLFTNGFSIQLVNSESEANTELYFDTRARLEETRPDFVGPVSATNAGKAQISFFNSGEIIASNIWINTDVGSRTATIKHEFLHAIGLGHANVQSSILFPSITSNSDLSQDDITVVRSLYHPSMPVGADTNEIDTALNTIL